MCNSIADVVKLKIRPFVINRFIIKIGDLSPGGRPATEAAYESSKISCNRSFSLERAMRLTNW